MKEQCKEELKRNSLAYKSERGKILQKQL